MSRYPEREPAYPKVFRKDTDFPLPARPDPHLRYAYFKTIAKGGTCIISSCKDLHLMRTICHKQLRPEIADDAYQQQRFIREARVTAMLQHPNTIPTYELGRDPEGHPYFTMKLVYGTTFREILDACGDAKSHNVLGYTLPKLINFLSQVAHALHYAHQHGVVHRDIKPENVLIGAFEEVLLLDWGLAKVWNPGESIEIPDVNPRLQQSGATKPKDTDPNLTAGAPLDGTPAYMSPEQLLSHNAVDHRSDIYGMGALLYELLTFQRMVPGETVDSVLDFLRVGRIQAPESRLGAPRVSKHLAEICMSCVVHDPRMRYQNMDHFIDHLEEWLDSPSFD